MSEFNIAIGTRYFEDERVSVRVVSSQAREMMTLITLALMYRSPILFPKATNIYLSIAEGFRSGGANFFQRPGL